MLATTQMIQEENDDDSSRKELLEQAFDIIRGLDDEQLNYLLERMGYVERIAV